MHPITITIVTLIILMIILYRHPTTIALIILILAFVLFFLGRFMMFKYKKANISQEHDQRSANNSNQGKMEIYNKTNMISQEDQRSANRNSTRKIPPGEWRGRPNKNKLVPTEEFAKSPLRPANHTSIMNSRQMNSRQINSRQINSRQMNNSISLQQETEMNSAVPLNPDTINDSKRQIKSTLRAIAKKIEKRLKKSESVD